MTDRPLTPDEFAAALLPLLPQRPAALGLAVSGGRDSTALMHLAAGFAQARGIRALALTVDHGLRPESASEAQRVGAAAERLGIAHRVLRWRDPGGGNLEARAREARYRLMAEACAAEDVPILLVAHTLDDQAETFLLRLARGSGVDGLAGMAPASTRLGLTIVRPLLDVPRARLTAMLKAQGARWFEDPMNRDPRFARVALREAAEVLAAAGLTPARLAATARHMARARAALKEAAAAIEAKALRVDPAGFAELDAASLRAAPEEIGLRVLARLVMRVGGLAYPPRFTGLARVYHLARDGMLGRGCTLGGCRLIPTRGEALLVVREPAAVAPELSLEPGRVQLWDGRFRVRFRAESPGARASVGGLGARGLKALRQQAPEALPRIAAAARPGLPCLWLGERLAAVPHLGFADPALCHIAAGFEAAFTGLPAGP